MEHNGIFEKPYSKNDSDVGTLLGTDFRMTQITYPRVQSRQDIRFLVKISYLKHKKIGSMRVRGWGEGYTVMMTTFPALFSYYSFILSRNYRAGIDYAKKSTPWYPTMS